MHSNGCGPRRRALQTLLLSATVALPLAGCGGDGEAATPTTPAQLTVESLCSDYVARAPEERQEAVTRITTKLGAPNAGATQWVAMADQRCAQAPDLKLGDFFNHFR